MKYGVIVCSKCKSVKGVLLSNKTTKCIRCGKNIKIDKVKIFYKTNLPEELRNYIGIVNKEYNK